jgi:hypothetical protein
VNIRTRRRSRGSVMIWICATTRALLRKGDCPGVSMHQGSRRRPTVHSTVPRSACVKAGRRRLYSAGTRLYPNLPLGPIAAEWVDSDGSSILESNLRCGFGYEPQRVCKEANHG